MTKRKEPRQHVKTGRVATQQADAEDVTRDTYGYFEAQPAGGTRDERIAQADRTAAAVGVPGVAVPESSTSDQSEDTAREEEFRRAEVAGDRTAPRRDVEKVRARRHSR